MSSSLVPAVASATDTDIPLRNIPPEQRWFVQKLHGYFEDPWKHRACMREMAVNGRDLGGFHDNPRAYCEQLRLAVACAMIVGDPCIHTLLDAEGLWQMGGRAQVFTTYARRLVGMIEVMLTHQLTAKDQLRYRQALEDARIRVDGFKLPA